MMETKAPNVRKVRPELRMALMLCLIIAGALGGVGGAMVFVAWGSWPKNLIVQAGELGIWAGGGVGTAIGATMAICTKFWPRMAAAIVLGLLGTWLGLLLWVTSSGFPLGRRELVEYAITLGGPLTLAMVVSHHFYFRQPQAGIGAILRPAVYIVLGGLSTTSLWIRATGVIEPNLLGDQSVGTDTTGTLLVVWSIGALYGLLQCGSLLLFLSCQKSKSCP